MAVSDELQRQVRRAWGAACPDGWHYRAVGSVLERVARPIDIQDDELYVQPVIRRGHGGLEVRERQYGRDILTKRQFLLRENDWLMSKVQILHRAYGIVPKDLDGAIASGSYYAFRPRNGLDLTYLWYLSHHPAFHRSCELASVGVVIEKMVFRVEDWETFELLLPPLHEQRTIAAILSSVDDAIAASQRVLKQATRVRRGLLQALAARGISHTRFKQSDVGEIPEEWETVRLGSVIASIEAGVSVRSENRPCFEGEIGVLKTGSVSGGRFLPEAHKAVVPEDRRRARVRPMAGRIIISRMNTQELVGECGLVHRDCENLFLPDRLWQISVSEEAQVEPSWIVAALNAPHIRSRVRALGSGTSGSMKNISQKKLLALSLPRPPLEEQRRMLAVLRTTTNVLDASEEALSRVQEIKRGLLQDLLTGRVRVKPD